MTDETLSDEDIKPAIVGKTLLGAPSPSLSSLIGPHTPLGLCRDCVMHWKLAEADAFGQGVPEVRPGVTMVLVNQLNQININGVMQPAMGTGAVPICAEHIVIQKNRTGLQAATGPLPPGLANGKAGG